MINAFIGTGAAILIIGCLTLISLGAVAVVHSWRFALRAIRSAIRRRRAKGITVDQHAEQAIAITKEDMRYTP